MYYFENIFEWLIIWTEVILKYSEKLLKVYVIFKKYFLNLTKKTNVELEKMFL